MSHQSAARTNFDDSRPLSRPGIKDCGRSTPEISNDAQAAKLFQGIHQLAEAAGEAIVAVDHDRIHLAFPAITPKPVEFRPMLVRSCGPHAGDLPASPIGVLHQLTELRRGVLSVEG